MSHALLTKAKRKIIQKNTAQNGLESRKDAQQIVYDCSVRDLKQSHTVANWLLR